jgi:hypothetical protein
MLLLNFVKSMQQFHVVLERYHVVRDQIGELMGGRIHRRIPTLRRTMALLRTLATTILLKKFLELRTRPLDGTGLVHLLIQVLRFERRVLVCLYLRNLVMEEAKTSTRTPGIATRTIREGQKRPLTIIRTSR